MKLPNKKQREVYRRLLLKRNYVLDILAHCETFEQLENCKQWTEQIFNNELTICPKCRVKINSIKNLVLSAIQFNIDLLMD